MELFKNKYFILASGIVSVLVIIAVGIGFTSMMKDNTGTSAVSDNAKLNQSKNIKSNVGDKTLGDGAMSLEGITAGNIGQIGNTTTNNSTDKSTTESSEDNSKK